MASLTLDGFGTVFSKAVFQRLYHQMNRYSLPESLQSSPLNKILFHLIPFASKGDYEKATEN